MGFLRPDDESAEAHGDELDPVLDAGVLDRLSAYAPDAGGEDEGDRELAEETEGEPEPTLDLSGEEWEHPASEAEVVEHAFPEDEVPEVPAEPTEAPEPEESGLYASMDEELAVDRSADAVQADDAPAEADGLEEEVFSSSFDEASDGDGVDPEPVVAEAAEAEEKQGRSFRRRREAAQTKEQKNERDGRHGKARKLVGLKIGASQIAAAQVVNNGAPELVEVFREPLEPGLVVSGEIRDPEGLGVALKRLFELHKLPKRGVRLGLSNNRIGVRIFEIEGVEDPQQLENAIRFRAEEVLPIPLDEAVLDYVVLGEEEREDGTSLKRILLVVAYREVVDRYLQACRAAGLEVVGIDLEAFALLRALEAPVDRGFHAGALVAVAIGHDRSTIAVSTGRHCEFARVLDWGGWSLNVAIARELDRAPSEVEGIKRQLSFAAATEVDGLTPEQTAKAREAIQRSLSGFVRELVASLQFYQAQPGALGIGEVVLTGGTAHMDGLPEALGELVGVPIRLGDPFKRVKVGPHVAHEGPRGSLSVAIGLGIED